MKKLLLILAMLISINVFSQKTLVYPIVEDQVTGQQRTLDVLNDSIAIVLHQTDTFPNGKKLLTFSSGVLKANIKLSTPYSGTTNASGSYSVTFPVAYVVTPNIQANIVGGTNTNLIKITSISTTAFTVNVVNRTDALGLLPTYSNVNGAAVDVLITEK